MKAALVTGVGRDNIGFGAARRFVERGLPVVAVDVRPPAPEVAERLAAGAAAPVHWLAADVADTAAIEAMAAEAFALVPGLDCLVNAAGIADPTKPLEITPERWDRLMDINLRGTFFACQAFARRLVAEGRPGGIVNLASMAARTGGRSNGLHYAASKAGVVSITLGLGRALGEHAIRVNAVAPGIIDTVMTRDVVPGSIHRAKEAALGRWGTIWEVADVILFLLSPESGYVTGTTVDVTGGA